MFAVTTTGTVERIDFTNTVVLKRRRRDSVLSFATGLALVLL